jgi:hypothetical protein
MSHSHSRMMTKHLSHASGDLSGCSCRRCSIFCTARSAVQQLCWVGLDAREITHVCLCMHAYACPL